MRLLQVAVSPGQVGVPQVVPIPNWAQQVLLSPTGAEFFFTGDVAHPGIYRQPAHGTEFMRLTREFDVLPVASQDGTRVAFWRESTLYVMNQDATQLRKVAETKLGDYEIEGASFTPDGLQLFYLDRPGLPMNYAPGVL